MMATKTMTAEHKQALAAGRQASRAISAYLAALEANKPKRGRRRTPDSIRARLAKIEAIFDDSSPLTRVQLIQERIDLAAELTELESGATVDLSALEAGFVEHAKAYSLSKSISYAAWREIGVEALVLKAAEIRR